MLQGLSGSSILPTGSCCSGNKGEGLFIEQLNVWIWGHAKIKLAPGVMWGRARKEALKPHGKIHVAHSDMSGISIFAEAQYRGIMAARAALRDVANR